MQDRFFATLFILAFFSPPVNAQSQPQKGMVLNKQEYLEYEGINVMLAHDFYPEGHQGGVGIIQNGIRVATNGDIRLEPTPGQWAPIPKVGKRMVNTHTQEVSVRMEYPNPEINRKGFNPIIYPNLNFAYNIKVQPASKGFKITVDLDKALPDEWIGKVGFLIELYPGALFGKSYYMDKQFGIFPQQAVNQVYKDKDGEMQVRPIAVGKRLTLVPELPSQTMLIENLHGDNLELLDGRANHTNGWFVVRSLVSKGAAKNAIEWIVTPNAITGWKSEPVVQVSQVGYHPRQQKVAVIELDAKETQLLPISLLRINENGGYETIIKNGGKKWGKFLRYNYLQFEFSSVQKPGMYIVQYGKYTSEPFQISKDVFKYNVWQPTVDYFLPAQMCHMRINDRYRVWHGACHLDDARMAPLDSNHFDGYISGSSTLTKYQPGDHVPNLNKGGWHDAGDFDIRVESQAETIHGLALAYEEFKVDYDNTTIDQRNSIVEIQRPDGKPDLLQQIEHGLLSVNEGYKTLGRFYRGIIEPTLRQYTLLGDAANITDNQPFLAGQGAMHPVGLSGSADDRWIFTEDNPGRSLRAATGLAAASRVMNGYNDTLSKECLQIAEEVWSKTQGNTDSKIGLAVELLITTGDSKYSAFLIAHTNEIVKGIDNFGWLVGRTVTLVNDENYRLSIRSAVQGLFKKVKDQGAKTPYGVPYEPSIWGAGWGIQNFGYKQYFLHSRFPEIFPADYMLHSLNFILGTHPGSNTESFVSGVGAKSATTAYGFNRADRSYIPGGIISGTALIRPDFPELLKWPFLWQQTEYVLGGGTTDYLFLVLAANKVLNQEF
ncbi:glycoside hydrolase family 9 protein [Arcticibacter eurypsychrophilus]|uniref:glycoside hydrolase family 9 protein n=1 Tax=Arcticibacter eurypsychrophilus TaxID=1434752 RepID=UPI00084DCDF4|nr:glycoside hydrolase family 9 protein [Arcticibacter eurypsychrophilus]